MKSSSLQYVLILLNNITNEAANNIAKEAMNIATNEAKEATNNDFNNT